MMSGDSITQKEKPHVVDHHRNSTRTMADRKLRPESSLQRSAHWKRDPYPACHRSHPHCFAPVGDHLRIQAQSLRLQLTLIGEERSFQMLYTIIIVLIVLFLIGYLR